MVFSCSDNGVLKLVHPGGHAEIHREPIAAAEIMRKYPRHCIARPDVFKFPWIVVRPESVLVPGKVFYIVPDRTIYKLLKAKGYRNQPPSQQNQSPDELKHHHYYDYEHQHYYTKRNSPFKSSAGTTLEYLGHDLYRRRQSTPWYEAHRELDSDDNMDNSYVRSWHEVNVRNRNGHHKFYQGSPVDSLFDSRPSDSESHCNRSNAAIVLHVTGHGHLHTRSTEHVELKSCLRKQDSNRKLLNRKVTFGSLIIIPTSPRESPPSNEENARA